MDESTLLLATREMIRLVLVLSAGPLAAALAAGGLVAIGQAMTQMNDPTIGLIARLLAVGLAIVLVLPWLLSHWLSYATVVLGGFPDYVL